MGLGLFRRRVAAPNRVGCKVGRDGTEDDDNDDEYGENGPCSTSMLTGKPRRHGHKNLDGVHDGTKGTRFRFAECDGGADSPAAMVPGEDEERKVKKVQVDAVDAESFVEIPFRSREPSDGYDDVSGGGVGMRTNGDSLNWAAPPTPLTDGDALTEVWAAVSSLPWQRESRRSRRLADAEKRKKVTRRMSTGDFCGSPDASRAKPGNLRAVRRVMSGLHLYHYADVDAQSPDGSRSKPVQIAEAVPPSAEDELVLQRLVSIFSREDWSTDIGVPSTDAHQQHSRAGSEPPGSVSRKDCPARGRRRDQKLSGSGFISPAADTIVFVDIAFDASPSPSRTPHSARRQRGASLSGPLGRSKAGGSAEDDSVYRTPNQSGSSRDDGSRPHSSWLSPAPSMQTSKAPSSSSSSSSYWASPGAWIFGALRAADPDGSGGVTPKDKSDWSRIYPLPLSSFSLTTSATPSPTSAKTDKQLTRRELKDRANRLHERVVRHRKRLRRLEAGTSTRDSGILSGTPGRSYFGFGTPTKASLSSSSPSRCATPSHGGARRLASPQTRFSMFGVRDAAVDDDVAVDASDIEYQLHEFWSECVVPNWSTFTKTIEESKVSFGINGSIFCRLWREGLPDKARQLLWPLALGNELKVTEELFDICCKQSKAKSGSIEKSSIWQLSSSLMSSLELDIQRTVDESHLSRVLKSRPHMKGDMLMVLEAFAQYR